MMDYKTTQNLFSVPRIRKYNVACGEDKQRTLLLYRFNIRLCQKFYGVLNVLEVILRNAINKHYIAYFSDSDWILKQAKVGGVFVYEQDDIRDIANDYKKRGVYNNDKMVSSLTFGYWTKLFSKKRYRLGGKTLLKIFPNKAKGKNQTDVYLDLTHIREFRNRIAHHEPICFDGNGKISTDFARKHYQLIRDYITYFGQDPEKVLGLAETPDAILDKIDKLVK